MTPEWMSSPLSGHHPGATVKDVSADPTRDLTARVPHLQPHRERRIRSSPACIHHVRVLVHDTSIRRCHDNGMSVFECQVERQVVSLSITRLISRQLHATKL
jgi:hypothetical protein